jgi:hypothetical protein
MKKIYILYSLMMLICVGLVSAAMTVNLPVASTSKGGTWTWNVTGALPQSLNCTPYIKSQAATANTTYVKANNTRFNTTVSQTSFQDTFNSSRFEDGSDYLFYVQCFNSTNHSESSSTVAIVIDNTVPVAPSSLAPVNNKVEDTTNDIVFSATVTDSKTTGCSLIFTVANPGETSYAMTYSASTCSYTLNKMPDQVYSYLIRATDGLNTTDSATQALEVDYNGVSAGGKFAIISNNQKSANPQSIISSSQSLTGSQTGGIDTKVVIAVIAIIVLYLLIFNKK